MHEGEETVTVHNITTKEELAELVDVGKPVVLDFHGEAWCVPCRRFAPTFEKAADGNSDLFTFAKVDVDVADKELVDEFHILSVPRVVAVTNSNEVRDLEVKHGMAFVNQLENL